ncbi:MAG: ATP-binding protein [Burkholderiaceae bacterium]
MHEEMSTPSLLRHMIDTIKGAIMVVDPSTLSLIDVNRITCQMLGYERDELLGQPVSLVECSLQDVFFWEDLKGNPKFDGERIIESEWLALSGASFPVEKCVTSFSEGDFTYWVIHVEDLTRRRTVEQEQLFLTAQLQASFEATAEGIMVADMSGNIVNMNRRFAEMWKLADDVLASRNETLVIEELLACLNNRAEFSATLAALADNAQGESEDVLSLIDGRYIVCVSKPQFQRDHLMGRVFSFRDITAMKQAETNLVAARDAAQQASQVKSQFLSQMSHELRTPLNSIIGFAQLLEMESDGSTREQLTTIARTGKHLLSIINEILDLSKIEAGRIEIETIPFSPIQIVNDVAALMEMQLREKGLKFSVQYAFPLPSIIHNDPTRFRQILLNLCMNALKYTEQGTIEVQVGCQGESLSIAIVDTGIGISDLQQKKLFAAFSQADSSTTRRYGGTGLGLYISNQLAQLLGGSITVESQPGVGSTFQFSIDTGPLTGVRMLQSLADMQSTSAANEHAPFEVVQLQGKVLLAEDGVDNQRLFCAYMEKAGIDVTVVENGSLAVEKALGGDFDLILMDMQMPVMGGLEATTILRSAAFVKPIVTVTANVMKEDIERYLAAGCTDYLSKPIDRDKFFQMLAKYLKPANSVKPKEKKPLERMDFFQELVKKFMAGLPDTLVKMNEAEKLRDWPALGGIAHMLKGTAGTFGYPHLTELAGHLNAAIRASKEDGVIIQSFSDLKAAIEAALAAHKK